MSDMASRLITYFVLHILCNIKNVINPGMFKEDLFELYINKTLMRTSNHAFLISVYYVGLQLFLYLFSRQLFVAGFSPFCFPD